MEMPLITEDASLVLNQSSNVTGVLYFKFNDIYFPSSRWFDFPVIVVGCLLDKIRDLLNGRSAEVDVSFMDGPYSIKASKVGNKELRIQFVEYKSTMFTFEVDERVFFHAVWKCADTLIAACDRNGWSTHDISQLKKAEYEVKHLLTGPKQ